MRLDAFLRQRLSLNTIVRVAIGLLLLVVFLGNESGISEVRFLQQLELQLYDARVRLFMPSVADPRVVILDIDEKSLAAEGRWPWGRDKVAALLRQLFDRYHVKVVGFDISFPEPDTSSGLLTLDRLASQELRDDAAFRQVLERVRPSLDYDRLLGEEIGKHPVVLGFFLSPRGDRAGVLPQPVFTGEFGNAVFRSTEATGFSGNRPELQEHAAAAGHLAPDFDVDGVTRRVPMLMRLDGNYYEAMALAVARTYLGNVPAIVRTDVRGTGKDAQGWVTSLQVGKHQIPLDDAMRALIPFRGPGHTFQYVSATDVLRGALPAGALADKIVIIGTSAQGLFDVRVTPVGEDYPGVEVHANMVSGILDQALKHRPLYATALSTVILLLIGLALALILPRLGVLPSTATTASVVAAIVAGNLIAWQVYGFVLNLAAPVLFVLLLYFFNMVYGFFLEARSRRLITGLFGTYVPKELVAEMSKNPGDYSMQGESRVMTVLFSDVRDFTSISEGLTPEALKEMMNTYLTAMTEVIQEKRGTIDKYIGDAIMAFWGAPLADPQHAAHALEAALDMQRRIRGLDPEFAKRGWPQLNIGVGLNCGEMNVGDMGSRFRRAYTVMGDSVNLASRLEGLTKEYGVRILVSEGIVAAAEGFVYREVDKVVVKGRTEGVAIYEPVGRQGEVEESVLADIDRFHKALALYRRQRWAEAEAILKALSYAAPDNKLYKLYLKRLAHFRENTPGPAWNGLWVFTTK
ncbi:MAG: CHASE2 domain-containing protein [Betaproteobacteria bacterium]